MQSCCGCSVMVGREPACRAHLKWEVMRAAPSSREGRAGATWRRVIVRGDLTAEPPAHCRLVSDHDLFEIVVLLDCTAIPPRQFSCSAGDRSFVPAVRVCGARRAAKVKDGAQRRRRFILDRSEHRATLSRGRGTERLSTASSSGHDRAFSKSLIDRAVIGWARTAVDKKGVDSPSIFPTDALRLR